MTRNDPPVVLRRLFEASCAELYAAWTDPVLVQQWLAPGPNEVERVEIDLRVGGSFRLDTRAPDGARHRITGRYKALEPGRRILKSWIYDGPLDLLTGAETELEVTVTPRAEGSCELTLTHRLLSRADVRDAYAADWPSCFDKLRIALN